MSLSAMVLRQFILGESHVHSRLLHPHYLISFSLIPKTTAMVSFPKTPRSLENSPKLGSLGNRISQRLRLAPSVCYCFISLSKMSYVIRTCDLSPYVFLLLNRVNAAAYHQCIRCNDSFWTAAGSHGCIRTTAATCSAGKYHLWRIW